MPGLRPRQERGPRVFVGSQRARQGRDAIKPLEGGSSPAPAAATASTATATGPAGHDRRQAVGLNRLHGLGDRATTAEGMGSGQTGGSGQESAWLERRRAHAQTSVTAANLTADTASLEPRMPARR
jgi:hypothetical protein